MTTRSKLIVENQNPVDPLREFFKTVLLNGSVNAILMPARLPIENHIMPMLVTDEAAMDQSDPLAPAFPLNAAKLVSKLTRKPLGQKIMVVLRPCEIRAFVELIKLSQGHMEEILVVGIDCLGAFSNRGYKDFLETCDTPQESTGIFFNAMISGDENTANGIALSAACMACTKPVPNGADIRIAIVNEKQNTRFIVKAQTSAGTGLLEQLDLQEPDETALEKPVAIRHLDQKITFRDEMISRTTAATDSIEKLTAYFSGCVNCYNCRVACPVCYCKECVFVTDNFIHDPFQYLQWANRKGRLKMPTDTLFFHLTRLAHISTACVGCGQCSNACPNDIPVMELFASVAESTQAAFDYIPGKSIVDQPPLSVFREKEFEEIVGIK